VPRSVPDQDKVVKFINSECDALCRHLDQEVRGGGFEYRTFGVDVEAPLIAKLVARLKDARLVLSEADYHPAANKNEFPDLTIYSSPKLAIEVKSGNRSQKDNDGEWVECTNSQNDLGTLLGWPDKVAEFGGENIYFMFVEYRFTDTEKAVVAVKFDHFYTFVGLNKAGVLSYREKDGNLRPKDFDAKPLVESYTRFDSLFRATCEYRSKRIIGKHLALLSEPVRRKYLLELVTRYGIQQET
jgi:hypothetical protein